MLGARGWQTFWRVTLPNIKWGLLYGVILCNARAMGEFGAVSVVSGHIRGKTNTMPLHVEILYNEYNFPAAFAVASLLAFLALVTLVAKSPGRVASRPGRSTHAHAEEPRMSIEVRDVTKPFGAFAALNDVSLTVPTGELVALLGPSGSGKTTLLRIIAGLERADRGQVLFDGEDATRPRRAPSQRGLRVPALRAVPPHDACSRTSPSACGCGRGRGARARRRSERR